jgi:hypothetical protein
VRVAKPDNLDAFISETSLLQHLKQSYVTLQQGFEAKPDAFLFVEYDDLLANPRNELQRIHAFLDLPPFEYDFDNIDGSTVAEDDEVLHGVAGLHDIAPKLGARHSQTAREALGDHYDKFLQPAFWRENDPPRELQPIDLQLAASKMGDFEKGWEIAQELARLKPNDNRAAYNRGWYLLRQGRLQEGFALMDRGRLEDVFGNQHPPTPCPQWDGKSKGIVLLYLEGGLGDQIHQVRYAKHIAARGCKVIVSCTGPLACLFHDVEGVSAVVVHEALAGVYHDYWVPGMSAVVPLGFEYEDLSGAPYIRKPFVEPHKRKRIGLRWSGNPMFEHEQNRVFPPELMFTAAKGVNADFISLQRDEGTEFAPKWVRQVSLDSWENTRVAIASCDLVITSCTSVSHLAAAMGVETWVVTPIMPYYLYARPGDKTEYYDSMRLFRQEVFGDWIAPFGAIKRELNKVSTLGVKHAVLGQG